MYSNIISIMQTQPQSTTVNCLPSVITDGYSYHPIAIYLYDKGDGCGFLQPYPYSNQ